MQKCSWISQIAASYDKMTRNLVGEFLKNAAMDMISVRAAMKLVLDDFSAFLNWLGIPSHLHADYQPSKFATIIAEFAKEVEETKVQITAEKKAQEKKVAAESKTQERQKMKRQMSMIQVDKKPIMNELVRRFSLRSPTLVGDDLDTRHIREFGQRRLSVDESDNRVSNNRTNLEDILNSRVGFQRSFKERKTGNISNFNFEKKKSLK